MEVTPTALPEVLLIEPKLFGDERGFFFESWKQDRYLEHGLPAEFVQDNISRSDKGTLRGLHFQEPNAQGKLVSVLQGQVFDVAVDVREGSPRFGKWIGVELDGEKHHQLWIPPGFAHGFCVLSESADFFYKCTTLYSPETEQAIRYDDPTIGIDWPVETPILSRKDEVAPVLAEAPVLPAYEHAE
ncbi:MAG TPA: dTDP-4-dehydrorhamnose 3,5-epimerase [Rhodospirillaceae bacterium]|nr:dTDP-4-dehydrorhamnose 3,5-epimerase [Rhodospirillaceae bacterium]HAA92117.1 dTDP-4-dehydrorhamnose 3,5-epimerase [Rhodospirillaceae bacterium]HAT35168.1 dTDP-4-dehydrorhamnose 3,5-epimerase [Rhodospirillaceae bacterium]|tara:strand:- start:235 stop:792 length:558 start_codon:yes stop_codon:yes gene_type:complete